MHRATKSLVQLGTIVTALVVWEAIVSYLSVQPWLLPGPVRIARALWDTRALLVHHTLHTLKAAGIGTLAAVSAGLFFGVIIHSFPVLRLNLYPMLVASQTVPTLVIAPLLTLWFGYGILPKVLLVALACFFPISVGVIDGLGSTDPDLISLAKTMGGTRWRIFASISWPASLPSMFTGLKVALTYAIIAAVVSEWMGAKAGLGVYLTRSSHSYLTDRVFAAIAVIAVLSLSLFRLVGVIESAVIPWHTKDNSANTSGGGSL